MALRAFRIRLDPTQSQTEEMKQSPREIHYAFLLALAKCRMRSTRLTYRDCAPVVGVNYSHLHRVLTGRRESLSLLERLLRFLNF
jgi:hypothetical protein